MPQVPVNGGVGTPTQSWCHSRGFQTTHRALFLHSPGGTLLELEGLNPLYRWTNQGPERNDWLSGSHSKSKSPQILGPLPAEPRHMIPEHKKCPRHEQQIPGLQKSPAIPRKWNSAFTDKELLKVSGLGQRVPGFLLPARGLVGVTFLGLQRRPQLWPLAEVVGVPRIFSWSVGQSSCLANAHLSTCPAGIYSMSLPLGRLLWDPMFPQP